MGQIMHIMVISFPNIILCNDLLGVYYANFIRGNIRKYRNLFDRILRKYAILEANSHFTTDFADYTDILAKVE